MAERTGRRQRQHSPTSSGANHLNQHQDQGDLPLAPDAPGATTSPQHPGMVPDRSTVPGQFATHLVAAPNPLRPLTEYGTAQRIMGAYGASPGDEGDPSRFEQATAAYEEIRKAYPAQLPPERPAPGYALDHGDAMASERQAIGAGPGPSAPATTARSGEAYNARPDGGTAEVAPPARGEASAAEVGSAFAPSDAPASVRSPADAVAGEGASTQSRWAEAAPSPGDLSSPAGTLPAAKEGETNAPDGSRRRSTPPSAPQ